MVYRLPDSVLYVLRPAIASAAGTEVCYRAVLSALRVELGAEVVVGDLDIHCLAGVGLAVAGGTVEAVTASIEEVVINGHVLYRRKVCEQRDGRGLAVPVLQVVVANDVTCAEAVSADSLVVAAEVIADVEVVHP